MILDFPLEQTVKARYSVRTYENRALSAEMKDKINAYIKTLTNPFSAVVTFNLLESSSAANAGKLGTYGVIKGAKDYIGATITSGEFSFEALGYEFEKLILYAASLGLGTCWLGGTFNRSEFANAMSVKKDELFPTISPLGYPANKKRVPEILMRKIIRADQRKPWNMLFFNQGFSVPLTESDAGLYAFPLEMLRLAPSASNKQPWRVVQEGNTYHFYEAKEQGYSDRLGYDIQKLD
ncbi:MAG: nitroreductase, partial [Oscillospiraceae bacterium]|nr:nitroreductase [Oscillospiraceae bacterium]